MDVEIENYMKTLNINDICRTCLSECDEMTSVYTEIEPTEDDEISYVYQILMNVASIQVIVGDGLPTTICKNCVESANNAFKFKILSERSEALLQTYLGQVEINEANQNNEDCIEDIQYEEAVESVFDGDHNYITEKVHEKEEIEIATEEDQCIPTNEVNSEEIQLEENGVQHSDSNENEENGTEEVEEESNFRSLLKSKNFRKHLPEDLDLNSVKVEIVNDDSDDPSIQELIVNPDIDLYDDSDEEQDASVVTSSDANMKLRERIKLKKISGLRASKPRKKLPHQTRINENGEKMYLCNYCNKEYKHSTSLTVHIRTHTLETPYVCKLCRKGFRQLTALTYHMRSHTGEAPYKCTICDKRYRQSASLTAHMRIHTGQRPFLCSVCGKGFRQSPDLVYHMRTHTKEKPYMCSVCGKRMSMQCHLVQHMRIHTGEKPYSCKECGKSFPSSTRLKRHEIIHTDIKPFECEVCKKKFNRSSSLKVHVMTHSEEKPFICKVCGKGFIQNHCLKSHLKTHSTYDGVLFLASSDREER